MSNREKIISPSFFIGNWNKDIISFGSGQPDLSPPIEIYNILKNYKDFKYGSISGITKLRAILANNYPNASSGQFVITNGASEALDLTLRVLFAQGYKSILLPRPYYYSYPYNAKYTGMKNIFYNLNDGKINLKSLLELMKKHKLLLINSPSNPTGSVQEVEVLKAIEKFAIENGNIIISDEVYKDLIYERENYLIKGPNVITINSFSKTYAMCGFRVGYAYSSNKKIIEQIIEYKTHVSMNTNILGQEMAFQAAVVNSKYYLKQVAIWKKRRDIIYNGLTSIGMNLWKPEGAFYVFPKILKPNKVINDLYYDYNIITYDGSWFGASDRIRLSYALEENKIIEGLGRLEKYIRQNRALIDY